MLGRNIIHKMTTLFTAMAVMCVYSMVALAAPKAVSGEIIVTGSVTVNGQPAVSGATVVSGSTIVTGANSSAIINFGANGKVEVLDESSLTLNFSENSITGVLGAGRLRVMNGAGVSATFTTKNATVIGDTAQSNSFLIDAGCGDDTKCAQTIVQTYTGLVTLRNGSSDKQVAAGTNASVGNPQQTGCKPCLRPNPNPGVFPVAGIGGGAIAALLIAIGAGVGALIYFDPFNDDADLDDGGVVISPVRATTTGGGGA